MYNDFDINVTHPFFARFQQRRLHSAVSRGLYHAARCFVLIGVLSAVLCLNWGFRTAALDAGHPTLASTPAPRPPPKRMPCCHVLVSDLPSLLRLRLPRYPVPPYPHLGPEALKTLALNAGVCTSAPLSCKWPPPGRRRPAHLARRRHGPPTSLRSLRPGTASTLTFRWAAAVEDTLLCHCRPSGPVLPALPA